MPPVTRSRSSSIPWPVCDETATTSRPGCSAATPARTASWSGARSALVRTAMGSASASHACTVARSMRPDLIGRSRPRTISTRSRLAASTWAPSPTGSARRSSFRRSSTATTSSSAVVTQSPTTGVPTRSARVRAPSTTVAERATCTHPRSWRTTRPSVPSARAASSAHVSSQPSGPRSTGRVGHEPRSRASPWRSIRRVPSSTPEPVELVRCDPADVGRLVVAGRIGTRWRHDDEPGVEVTVRAGVGRVDFVDVEVDRDRVDAQPVDPGLLGRLPERDRGQVGVAVGVAPGLEPAAQLAVEQEHDPLGGVVDHQGRAGQVTGEARAVEGVVVGVHEVEDRRPVLLGVGVDVGGVDEPAGDREIARRGEPGIVGGQQPVGHRARR